MTIDRETVIRLARDAGALIESWMTQPPKPSLFYMSPEQLMGFAALVLEHGRKPLTDAEIAIVLLRAKCTEIPGVMLDYDIEIARAIESAHGIANKESSDAE